jgi:creatinine amidohydrolase
MRAFATTGRPAFFVGAQHCYAPTRNLLLEYNALRISQEAIVRHCIVLILCGLSLLASQANGQGKLSVKWEELTVGDFRAAITKSQGTCLLPFGILEKHGPHLPLGTDLLNVRYVAEHAAEQEYAVVFPAYYAGQIFEAKHQPGTIAYSPELQLSLLQETTDEMARNGCKKVVIVNGHGGNEHLLPFFAQSQLYKPHDYVVYVQWGHEAPKRAAAEKKGPDYHAGERETSDVLVSHPDLVHMDRAKDESGADQARVKLPESVYTGIWWYARFPNHYSGDGSAATKEEGEADVQSWIKTVVGVIRAIKADDESLKLQKQFYEESQHPLDTPQ